MDEPTATEPPPSAPPRRLTRSTSDRMVAGVCGGLAEYTGIDPVVFRVVAVVAAIMGGSGLLAYLLAWIVIPEASSERSHAETFLHDRKRPKAVAVALGVLAVLVLGSMIDGQVGRPHIGGGGFGLVLLVGFAVWLWMRSERTPVPAVPPTPPLPGMPPAPPVPVPPRERSRLFGVTMSVALLAAGVLAGVHASGAAELQLEHIFAVCLVVVGAGLVAGAWVGRARGLIVVGVLLTILTAGATAADVPMRGGIGARDWRPRTVAELRPEYHLAMGELRLDLDRLDLDGAARRVEASVGMGELLVWLPDDVEVVIEDADAGMGETIVPELVVDPSKRTNGRLVLDLRVGMGRLEVRR